MKLLIVPACLVVLVASAPGVPAATGEAGAEPPLLLQYDFFDVQDGQVPDGSGHGNPGAIVAGTVVAGRRKPAVELLGSGRVVAGSFGSSFDFTGRAMTVGAMCRPAGADGVVVSMGDTHDGFSLYLERGLPHFAVRSRGELHEVADSEPLELGQWVHLAGVIEASGEISLLVNAYPVARAAGRALLARTPDGSLVVGADSGAPVGSSTGEPWRGLLEDVRIYGGAVSRDTNRDLLGDWANRPGCGCRK